LICAGSIGIGLTMGMLLAFITKRVRIADSHYHISFILLTGFFTYCWANFVSMSGIMALFFCAVVRYPAIVFRMCAMTDSPCAC
jgi:NhaP-type Na+/H+ or K+/H+ antiporter